MYGELTTTDKERIDSAIASGIPANIGMINADYYAITDYIRTPRNRTITTKLDTHGTCRITGDGFDVTMIICGRMA